MEARVAGFSICTTLASLWSTSTYLTARETYIAGTAAVGAACLTLHQAGPIVTALSVTIGVRAAPLGSWDEILA